MSRILFYQPGVKTDPELRAKVDDRAAFRNASLFDGVEAAKRVVIGDKVAADTAAEIRTAYKAASVAVLTEKEFFSGKALVEEEAEEVFNPDAPVKKKK